MFLQVGRHIDVHALLIGPVMPFYTHFMDRQWSTIHNFLWNILPWIFSWIMTVNKIFISLNGLALTLSNYIYDWIFKFIDPHDFILRCLYTPVVSVCVLCICYWWECWKIIICSYHLVGWGLSSSLISAHFLCCRSHGNITSSVSYAWYSNFSSPERLKCLLGQNYIQIYRNGWYVYVTFLQGFMV